MKCPTEAQILEAAKTSAEARKALGKLFPELFEDHILPGQIYQWGSSSDGNDGVVIHNPGGQGYSFVNYRTGQVYLPYIPKLITKTNLQSLLEPVFRNPNTFEKCYDGRFEGPKRIKTWTTK